MLCCVTSMVSGVSVLVFGVLAGPGVSCTMFILGGGKAGAVEECVSVLSGVGVIAAVCSCLFCVVLSVSFMCGSVTCGELLLVFVASA